MPGGLLAHGDGTVSHALGIVALLGGLASLRVSFALCCGRFHSIDMHDTKLSAGTGAAILARLSVAMWATQTEGAGGQPRNQVFRICHGSNNANKMGLIQLHYYPRQKKNTLQLSYTLLHIGGARKPATASQLPVIPSSY